MRVAITGSSGLVGTAVRDEMLRRRWKVTRIVRAKTSPGSGAVAWDPVKGRIDAVGLEAHDVIVHTAGESLLGIWTPEKKRRIERSRVLGTRLLASALASLQSKPRLLISFSAMGYYGDRDPAEPMTEDKPPGKGFLAEVCARWEAATRAAEDAGIRVVHARLANVMSAQGGMLGVLRPIFRLGLGARFGNGQQMWPWIALPDVAGAALHVIEHEELQGPVNFVAPQAVTNAQFTESLARALNRPSLFVVPALALELAPGRMGKEMLLSGARLVPKRLLDSGYEFQYTELDAALRDAV